MPAIESAISCSTIPTNGAKHALFLHSSFPYYVTHLYDSVPTTHHFTSVKNMTIQSLLLARVFLNTEEINSSRFLNHSSLRKHVLALSKSRKVHSIHAAESLRRVLKHVSVTMEATNTSSRPRKQVNGLVFVEEECNHWLPRSQLRSYEWIHGYHVARTMFYGRNRDGLFFSKVVMNRTNGIDRPCISHSQTKQQSTTL